MEVVVFDVSVLAMKMTWLMRESITCPVHRMLMKTWLVVLFFFSFCIFNNSANIKPNHSLLHTERSGVTCSFAGWYHLTEAIMFDMFVFLSFCLAFVSCVFVVMSERKVKTEFILWYRLPVETREMLTQGDTALVSALSVTLHLSFPVSKNLQRILWQKE